MKNKKGSNDSAGLHIYCDDRKKTFRSQAKIPSPQAILHGFLLVIVRALNSYERREKHDWRYEQFK
ncbi:hypothetical protein [Blautia marasmi]|uniref:hypothetical protein n=1 Tax=Blautia marasmi TaxID=1917868 RepID=UPI00210D3898|nr:hypothetical protein [Blautia marasmi]